MKSSFTAIIKRDGACWIGWIEEIPGVNAQGKDRRELLSNLRSALREAIRLHRKEALAAAQGGFEGEILEV